MAERVTRVYRCLAGEEFAVEWASEDEANQVWTWDPEHSPGPATPMDAAVWHGCASGAGRARAECGFAATDIFIGSPAGRHLNGFSYGRSLPPKLSDRRRARATNERLRREFENAADFWERWCVPRARGAFENLRDGAARPVAELLDLFGYGFEQTFLMWGIDEDGLESFLVTEMGTEGELLAVGLTRGRATATLDADQALWELAREAAAFPALREALLAGVALDSLGDIAGTGRWIARFQRYLDVYGWRTVGWDVSTPTLRERPEVSLQVIARTVAEDLPEPAERLASAAREREAVAEEVAARFAADPTKALEFRRRLDIAARYLGVKEGRAFWQLSLCGAFHHALLAKGARLVELGLLGGAHDVFYLLPGEVDAILGDGELPAQAVPGGTAVPSAKLVSLVAERRAERERWMGVIPPARIGGRAPEPPPLPAAATELRGVAASGGAVTARARVLQSMEEYERLGLGEVLVCATTTPAWAPLFAVAGGVVADGGDPYSHTGIAAREYGIPAVTGVHGATVLIADGQVVTVDGTAGVVRLEA